MVKADIAIYSNNEELLSSSVFDVEVVKASYDEDAVISTNEFSELTHALSEAQNATSIASAAATAAQTATSAANTATSAANSAASDARDAIDAIYHDKNFLLTVNEDSSLTLTYSPGEEEA